MRNGCLLQHRFCRCSRRDAEEMEMATAVKAEQRVGGWGTAVRMVPFPAPISRSPSSLERDGSFLIWGDWAGRFVAPHKKGIVCGSN